MKVCVLKDRQSLGRFNKKEYMDFGKVVRMIESVMTGEYDTVNNVIFADSEFGRRYDRSRKYSYRKLAKEMRGHLRAA